MTLVLVRKLLRDSRWPLLAVCVLLFVFSAFWVKIAQRVTTEIAPFFLILGKAQGANKDLLDEVVFKGPGKISQAVLGGSDIRFENPNDFLAMELLHPVIIILASLWAVGRAASAVSGELDRGTMELLLSQPVPRNRLILAHFLVDLLVIPLICLAIPIGTQTGLALVGPFEVDYTSLRKLNLPIPLPTQPEYLSVDTSGQPAALLNLAALMFALSGLTMAISAAGRSRWRTIGFAVVTVVVMFVATTIGQLWEPSGFVRPLTLFFYSQPQKAMLDGNWVVDVGKAWPGAPGVPGIGVLLAVGAAGYLLALRAFTRRDLPAPL